MPFLGHVLISIRLGKYHTLSLKFICYYSNTWCLGFHPYSNRIDGSAQVFSLSPVTSFTTRPLFGHKRSANCLTVTGSPLPTAIARCFFILSKFSMQISNAEQTSST